MRRVTISPEVVSEIHFRDKVAPEEKSVLFYNYSEELRFTEDKEEEQQKAEAEGLSWEEWVNRQTDDDVNRDEIVETRDPADYLYDYFDEGSVKEDDANNNYLMSSMEYGSTEILEQKSGSSQDENNVNYDEDFIENDDDIKEDKIISTEDIGNIQEDSMYKDNFESSNNGSDPETSQNQSDPASIDKYVEDDFEGAEDGVKIDIEATENPPATISGADVPYSSSSNSDPANSDTDVHDAINNIVTEPTMDESNNDNGEYLEYSANFSNDEYDEGEKVYASPIESEDLPAADSNQVIVNSIPMHTAAVDNKNTEVDTKVEPIIDVQDSQKEIDKGSSVENSDNDHDYDDEYMTAGVNLESSGKEDCNDNLQVELLNGDERTTVDQKGEEDTSGAAHLVDITESSQNDIEMKDINMEESEGSADAAVAVAVAVAAPMPGDSAPVVSSTHDVEIQDSVIGTNPSAPLNLDDFLGSEMPVLADGDDNFEFAYSEHNVVDGMEGVAVLAAASLLEGDNGIQVDDDPVMDDENVSFEIGYDHHAGGEVDSAAFPSNALMDESIDQIIVDQFREEPSAEEDVNTSVIATVNHTEEQSVENSTAKVQCLTVDAVSIATPATLESTEEQIGQDTNQTGLGSIVSNHSVAEQSIPMSPSAVNKGSIGQEEGSGELYQEDFAVSVGEDETNAAIAVVLQSSPEIKPANNLISTIIVDQFREDPSAEEDVNTSVIATVNHTEERTVETLAAKVQCLTVDAVSIATPAPLESIEEQNGQVLTADANLAGLGSTLSNHSVAEQSIPMSPSAVNKVSIGQEESGGELYQEDFAVSVVEDETNAAIAVILQSSPEVKPANNLISTTTASSECDYVVARDVVNDSSPNLTTTSVQDSQIYPTQHLSTTDTPPPSILTEVHQPVIDNTITSFVAEFYATITKIAIQNTVRRKILESKHSAEPSHVSSQKVSSPGRDRKELKKKSIPKPFIEKRFVDMKPILKETNPLIEAAAQRKKLHALQKVSKKRFINRTQHMLASLCCNVCNDISSEYTNMLNQLITREEITLSNEACEDLYEFYDLFLEDLDPTVDSIGQERRIDYDNHISKVVNKRNAPGLDIDHKETLLNMINELTERYRTHLSTNMRDIDKYSHTFSATIEKLSSIYKSQRLFTVNSFNEEQLRAEVARIYTDNIPSASWDVTEAARHAQEGLMSAKHRMKESFQELLKSDELLRRHLTRKIQMLSNIDRKIKKNELIQTCDIDDLTFDDMESDSPQHGRQEKLEIKIDTSYRRIGGADSPVSRLSRGFSSQSMGISLQMKKGAKSPGKKSTPKGFLSGSRIQKWVQLSTNPTFSMAKFLLNGGNAAVAVEEDEVSAKRVLSSSAPNFAVRPKSAAGSSVTAKDRKKYKRPNNISFVKQLTRPLFSFPTSNSRSKVYNAPADDPEDDREEMQQEVNPMKAGMRDVVLSKNNLAMPSTPVMLPVMSCRDDTLLQSIFYAKGLDFTQELTNLLNESQVARRIDLLLLTAMEQERMHGNNVDYSFLTKQSRHLRTLTSCIFEYSKKKFVKNFNAIVLGDLARREARLEYILFLLQLTLNHKEVAAPFTAGLKTSKSVYSLAKSKSADFQEVDGGKKASKKASSSALDRKIERAISDLVAVIQELSHSRFQLQRECMTCLFGVPYFVSTYHAAVEMQLSRDSSDSDNAFKPSIMAGTGTGEGDEEGQGLFYPLYGTAASWDSLYAVKSRVIATLCQSRKQRLDDVAHSNVVKSRELRRLITQTDS
eukprot:gene27155-35880_t